MESYVKEKLHLQGTERATLSLEGGDRLRLELEAAVPLLEYVIRDSKKL